LRQPNQLVRYRRARRHWLATHILRICRLIVALKVWEAIRSLHTLVESAFLIDDNLQRVLKIGYFLYDGRGNQVLILLLKFVSGSLTPIFVPGRAP
jgi:hypothetical protein